MSFFDMYQMDFSIEAELEDIHSWHHPVTIAVPRREHFLFRLESRIGGVFEMRTKPDDFGKVATFVQGKHVKSLLHDLMYEASHARRIAGDLEKYGDHLASCHLKVMPKEEDDFDYDEYCDCGFEDALHSDEAFSKRIALS